MQEKNKFTPDTFTDLFGRVIGGFIAIFRGDKGNVVVELQSGKPVYKEIANAAKMCFPEAEIREKIVEL